MRSFEVDKPILNFLLTMLLLVTCASVLLRQMWGTNRRPLVPYGTGDAERTETEQPGLDMGNGLLGPLWRNDKSDFGSR